MKKRKLITKKREKARERVRKNLYSFAFICGLISLFLFAAWLNFESPQKVSAEETIDEIENALYTRQEFFGARAIVPLPTAEARENLARLLENAPNADSRILEKLAELDEKLLRFDEAEKSLTRLAEIDGAKLENLAAFYHRRARFDKEAEVLRKILFSADDAEKRAATFEQLIDLARRCDLKQYLENDFYAEVAKENASVYEIFEKLIDTFAEEKNYAESLKFLRQAKRQFPENKDVLLEKEIKILLDANKLNEAESVYRAAFDLFWSAEEAEKFYEFLSYHGRLRAYGAELKKLFKDNSADFDAGVKLALYRKYDSGYGNGEVAPVILKLEKAKKNWTTDELVTAARLLLQENEAESASRFLYTLYAREDFRANEDLRAKILYQLFEMFSDAENERLPLVKGDLRFYEDAAKADTSPGIATGILSLIFSDTNPREKLDEQEIGAAKYFNRTAAYRVFLRYKEESPVVAPELAQMYLDIVRLYTATKETEIAEKTLNEFAERYENSSDYPAAALKLADAYSATNQKEKTREIHQKILDYLGKQKRNFAAKTNETFDKFDLRVPTKIQNRNEGINVPDQEEKPKSDYYDNKPKSNFRDYLKRKREPVTYGEVLEILVASLAAEKKTSEILALYSDEIAKYPDEEWLYEERLKWLEQTNLIEEQLSVYQAALARFKSRGWQDKLARWFLRENRQTEFAEFSTDLIGKLNDAEAQKHLSQFVDGKISANDFNRQLYLKLYRKAHERFPHNIIFVNGLLRFYKTNKQTEEWRKLAAEYYFESKEVREQFLNDLAERGELRAALENANDENIIYELFRADASVRLSNYENAIAAYRKLNQIYPNTPEFSERLIAFTRSFGQKNRELLTEAASVSKSQADFSPASAEYRTTSGEISAELGDYEKARAEWEKLISTAPGAKEIYLDATTVYWDYFQYDAALRTIKTLREKFADDSLYAFEAGAILEARREKARAIGEYVKAFDAAETSGEEGEGETQKEKAIKRLTVLFARETGEGKLTKDGLEKIIETAVSSESKKRKDASFLSLGYAEFLVKIKRAEKAESVLNAAIARSRNIEFLEASRDFYEREEIKSGERIALKRLAEAIENPRQAISCRLQLAESFAESGDRDSAKAVLAELARKFPTNFGVLTEASDFFWRLGFENESIEVLQTALPQSVGEYRSALAEKLARRLTKINRLDSAEQILTKLHGEDKADAEIFRQLADIYIRRDEAGKLREAFVETVAAIKKSDADRREIDAEIAVFRGRMIDAFTKLKDYASAIEQYIEIINREPENEESIENAIKYVRRYGGAETLLNYYLKTSTQSFKNYRWNIVLARIYEANGDYENAAKNYQAAIVNQPEMTELYLSLADLETKRNRFDEAIKNVDTVLELTNDAPEFVKKKIEILKKADRLTEVETEKAKLPVEEKPKTALDEFAEARALQNTEKEKSRALFREAFGKLLENPLSGEMKTADIAAYVQSGREEEPLDQISARLWLLRGKLIEISEAENSTNAAGEARKRLSILDAAMIESVGAIAKEFGTDDELAALHADLRKRIEEIQIASDKNKIISLVQDLSRRAGLGDLEELILLKKLKESNEKEIHLKSLISFYNERGAYQKTFDVLEQFGTDDLSLRAETARLVGDRATELEALRMIYWKDENLAASSAPNADVARYFEILRAENRAELKSLTEKSSAYQLQLVNFLLGAGERELAHAAIESARRTAAWKLSRHAETSLALKEFDDAARLFFSDALQLESIGDFIQKIPDKKNFLTNDDWFRLSREYGEWLGEKAKTQTDAKDESAFSEADGFLIAMTENQPRNAEEQFKLGEFYLKERGRLQKAIEHLRLAIETENLAVGDGRKLATLGAALYLSGETDSAEKYWEQTLEDESIESGMIHFETLQQYGLGEKAREKLPPLIVKFLRTANADDSEDFQNLIRAVAASFKTETEKAAYFLQILEERPTDTSLAEMLVGENLIGKDERSEFYESLINRSDGVGGYDYDYSFAPVVERVWSNVEDAESIYDQENAYKTEEPETQRLRWQKEYLEFLLKRGENIRAGKLIAEIEKELTGRYARPAWLRLAELRLQIRAGKFASTRAERFIGISVSDAATEINPPSVERFNEVLRILNEENKDAKQISESFFARMLALGDSSAANFAGLARVFSQKSEPEKAARILRLMIDTAATGDESKRETALAEIASMEAIKAHSADAAKLSETKAENQTYQPNALLKLAAEIAAGFGRLDAAIEFRRRLLDANPNDSANRLELAVILFAEGEKQEAANLSTQVANDRNSPRSARWRARLILSENGEKAEFPDVKFDSLSQFYRGVFAAKNDQNESAAAFFVNSLITDKDAETSARRELIKLYASSGKYFAALKLAETDKSTKPDDLLQALSEAAEKTGNFQKAIEFEKAKSSASAERIERLQKLENEKNLRATDLMIDLENTRKL